MVDYGTAIECKMNFMPVSWPEGAARNLFESLIGPKKLFPAKRWGDEIEKTLPEGTALYEILLEKFALESKQNRIKIGLSGKQVFSWKFLVNRDELDEGGEPIRWNYEVEIFVPYSTVEFDEYFDVILKAAHLCKSHLFSFDYRGPGVETISAINGQKMMKSVRSKVHKISPPGDWRGLSCVPWRLALGDCYIEMFGEDRLRRLPSDLGYRHSSGYWVLQTSENAEDSLDGEARENEQKIIGILGQEFFFNKETGELPEVVPDFPPELIPSDQALIDEYGPLLAD